MKKILFGIIAIIMGVSLVPAPVFADGDDNCVSTSIIGGGKVCDNGEGDSVYNILTLVIDIMTIGIGILAVIGITVVGIQYLTAGGNEEKTRKSKQRMLDIVIGHVVYVLIYALLRWLIPAFTMPGS